MRKQSRAVFLQVAVTKSSKFMIEKFETGTYGLRLHIQISKHTLSLMSFLQSRFYEKKFSKYFFPIFVIPTPLDAIDFSVCFFFRGKTLLVKTLRLSTYMSTFQIILTNKQRNWSELFHYKFFHYRLIYSYLYQSFYSHLPLDKYLASQIYITLTGNF